MTKANHCINCNSRLLPDIPWCPECWQPVEGLSNPEVFEYCLHKATGREWIALARGPRDEIVLMEQHPIAIMGFQYRGNIPRLQNGSQKPAFEQVDTKVCWESSDVRGFLNGPYLASLPPWVAGRLVPIDAEEWCYHVSDNVSILSSDEMMSLLRGAPKNPRRFSSPNTSPAETADEEEYEEFTDDCDDCYDGEGSLEYSDDYDDFEQLYFYLEDRFGSSDLDELRRAEEQWDASMLYYCSHAWSRDFELVDYSRLVYPYESHPDPTIGAVAAGGVNPVICLRPSSIAQKKTTPINIGDTERILQRFDEWDLVIDSEMEAKEAVAIQAFAFGVGEA